MAQEYSGPVLYDGPVITDAPKEKPAPAAAPEPEDSALGFTVGNINKGIAGFAGLPLDTAQKAMNLGIAGYGAVKGALGGQPPDLLPPPVGGSEWFEKQMRRGGMMPPESQTTPTSTPGRLAAAGLQALPGALAGRPSIAQLPRAATAAITSGVGSEIGRDVAPEGYEEAGAQVGALVPGARRLGATPTAAERAAAERKADAFAKAKELKTPVAPSEMKLDKKYIAQEEAIMTKDLGLPAGTKPTAEVLQNYRDDKYATGYEPVAKAFPNNTVTTNPKFRQEIDRIGKQEEQLRKEFPGSVKDVGLQDALKDFKVRAFHADSVMDQIKRLREGATNNLSSATATDDTIRMGLVQKRIANALEQLLEDQLAGKPEILKNFREARVKMAMSHAVQESLDPSTGRINQKKLAALLTEGGPLTGQLRQVAEVAQEFPGAVKPLSPDAGVFTKRMSPYAVSEPKAATAHLASHLLDPIRMSRPYQSMFVDPRMKLTPEQERLQRLMIGLEAGQQQQPPQ